MMKATQIQNLQQISCLWVGMHVHAWGLNNLEIVSNNLKPTFPIFIQFEITHDSM